jgi:hypothetical protein
MRTCASRCCARNTPGSAEAFAEKAYSLMPHVKITELLAEVGDLAHLSPLGCEHINLTGDYHWDTSPILGPDQFRALRTRAHDFAAAASVP